MKLQSLTIELVRYGARKGQYEAKIRYAADDVGGVDLHLTSDASADLLVHVGAAIAKFSSQAAQKLNEEIATAITAAKAATLPSTPQPAAP